MFSVQSNSKSKNRVLDIKMLRQFKNYMASINSVGNNFNFYLSTFPLYQISRSYFILLNFLFFQNLSFDDCHKSSDFFSISVFEVSLFSFLFSTSNLKLGFPVFFLLIPYVYRLLPFSRPVRFMLDMCPACSHLSSSAAFTFVPPGCDNSCFEPFASSR